MKVLLINSSPHKEGCTFTALSEVAKGLAESGIESEIFQLGQIANAEPIKSCIACSSCKKTGECILKNPDGSQDAVNSLINRLDEFDGLVLGSPVHYAAASGTLTTFCDRLFFAGGPKLAYKPGAAIVSCRRAGSTAALDQINKYFAISNMPIVPSQYWNMVHGARAEQVAEDIEGLQTMRVLGRNMAWMIRSFSVAREAGVQPVPYLENEKRQWTNFTK